VDIATGAAEQHPNVLPLNPQPAPDPVTPRFPGGAEQGGVLGDISGVDFTGEASAAMAAGMSADADRRAGYAAGMAPLGGSTGDEMSLPGVVSDLAQHTGGTNATSYDPAG
jgi:hypothetical protein